MSTPRKFLFDATFGPNGPEGSTATAQKKLAKIFTEQDLAQARSDSFAAGEQAGRKVAEESVENRTACTLTTLSQQFADLAKAQAAAEEHRCRAAVAAAVSVIRKLFPKLAETHGVAEIEAIVAECLSHLRDEPRVVIRVADALLDSVNGRVAALAAQAGFDGKIVLLPQDGLRLGDVRIEWADGGAERNSDLFWHKVEELIERVMGNAPPTPAEAKLDSNQANPTAQPPATDPDRPTAASQ